MLFACYCSSNFARIRGWGMKIWCQNLARFHTTLSCSIGGVWQRRYYEMRFLLHATSLRTRLAVTCFPFAESPHKTLAMKQARRRRIWARSLAENNFCHCFSRFKGQKRVIGCRCQTSQIFTAHTLMHANCFKVCGFWEMLPWEFNRKARWKRRKGSEIDGFILFSA